MLDNAGAREIELQNIQMGFRIDQIYGQILDKVMQFDPEL